MSPDVVISVRPGRCRAALVKKGELVDLLVIDDARTSLVGNIYLGRVEKVVRPLSAAFVDLGGGVSGFLAAADTRPPGAASTSDISDYVREGQTAVVQVQRDGFEDKAPKLTTRISLGGRAMILTPGDPGLRLSRRIGDKAERARLETLAGDLAQPGEGFVLRTAAVGLSAESLAQEATALRRDWAGIGAEAGRRTPPALLSGANDPVPRILRDFIPGDVGGITIDDPAAFSQARAWCAASAPGLTDRLRLFAGAGPLFEAPEAEIDIEAAIETALSPAVALPSGGSVLFAETPALLAIDVNTGGAVRGGQGRTALASNLEAVDLIARQIRLRNLSGLLVVDFVSMKSGKDRGKVLNVLKSAVAGDPGKVFVGGFTRFGLLEMTRRRTRPPLSAMLMERCAPCEGRGRVTGGQGVAYRALDRLAHEAGLAPADRLSLAAGPAVIAALQGPAAAALALVNHRFGRQFRVFADVRLAADGFEIIRNADNEQ